jgi:hypothetical protein
VPSATLSALLVFSGWEAAELTGLAATHQPLKAWFESAHVSTWPPRWSGGRADALGRGVVASAAAVPDESALTGESRRPAPDARWCATDCAKPNRASGDIRKTLGAKDGLGDGGRCRPVGRLGFGSSAFRTACTFSAGVRSADADTVLRLAASLDRVSTHVFANAIVPQRADEAWTSNFPPRSRSTPAQESEGLWEHNYPRPAEQFPQQSAGPDAAGAVGLQNRAG